MTLIPSSRDQGFFMRFTFFSLGWCCHQPKHGTVPVGDNLSADWQAPTRAVKKRLLSLKVSPADPEDLIQANRSISYA